MIWLIFGPPGSGKGTQARFIGSEFGLTHLSTGEVLRAEAAGGSEEGRQVAALMRAGQLVPDPVMVRIVSERLRRNPEEDVLLDGFPRTVEQARALDELLVSEGRRVDQVVALTVAEEVLIDRLLQRAQVENRADDTRQAIEERMHEYHERTEPVLAHYRAAGVPVAAVDGVGDPGTVFARIREAVRPVAGPDRGPLTH
ncbi:MAG: adenylate kinase [Candidatus Dormibacteraeota bacterium]|nr:adenylate kinase [Candidatus Dormibacteraeota bacterium]